MVEPAQQGGQAEPRTPTQNKMTIQVKKLKSVWALLALKLSLSHFFALNPVAKHIYKERYEYKLKGNSGDWKKFGV